GAYFSSHFAPDLKNQKVKYFVEAYKKMCEKVGCKNKTPNALAALGYDTMMLLKNAIECANFNSELPRWRTSVRDAIADTINFQGVTGEITNLREIKKSAVMLKIRADTQSVVPVATIDPPAPMPAEHRAPGKCSKH